MPARSFITMTGTRRCFAITPSLRILARRPPRPLKGLFRAFSSGAVHPEARLRFFGAEEAHALHLELIAR